MKQTLLILLCLSASLPLFAADGFSSLEEQMTGQEFSAAGLNKLSQAELDSLNNWIRRHSLATLKTPKTGTAGAADTSSDRRGFKDDKDRTPITSHLVGSFTGWDGQTTFKLENGMVWVQTDKDKFYVKEVQNPAVVIEPGMFGSWHLHIKGNDSKCRVERIQ